MILKILSPISNKNEIQWVIKTIFKDFLGIQFDIEFEDRNNFCIFFNNKKLCRCFEKLQYGVYTIY